MEKEKQIEIPEFLKESNFTERDLEIESGCSENITLDMAKKGELE